MFIITSISCDYTKTEVHMRQKFWLLLLRRADRVYTFMLCYWNNRYILKIRKIWSQRNSLGQKTKANRKKRHTSAESSSMVFVLNSSSIDVWCGETESEKRSMACTSIHFEKYASVWYLVKHRKTLFLKIY